MGDFGGLDEYDLDEAYNETVDMKSAGLSPQKSTRDSPESLEEDLFDSPKGPPEQTLGISQPSEIPGLDGLDFVADGPADVTELKITTPAAPQLSSSNAKKDSPEAPGAFAPLRAWEKEHEKTLAKRREEAQQLGQERRQKGKDMRKALQDAWNSEVSERCKTNEKNSAGKERKAANDFSWVAVQETINNLKIECPERLTEVLSRVATPKP